MHQLVEVEVEVVVFIFRFQLLKMVNAEHLTINILMGLPGQK